MLNILSLTSITVSIGQYLFRLTKVVIGGIFIYSKETRSNRSFEIQFLHRIVFANAFFMSFFRLLSRSVLKMVHWMSFILANRFSSFFFSFRLFFNVSKVTALHSIPYFTWYPIYFCALVKTKKQFLWSSLEAGAVFLLLKLFDSHHPSNYI